MTMNSEYCYWYFNEALTHKFCDDVIQRGTEEKENLALTGKFEKTSEDKLTEEQINDLKKQRNSNITWLSDSWIYRTIHPFIHKANENAGWNYQWDFSEACQFTKYKINQYYNWHCDSWTKPYDKPNEINYNGKIRKLSVSCQLTDSSEYEGGELEFQPRNTEDPGLIISCNEARKKGSIIVFPSHIYHRVKPVTQGTRYSLVIWNLGFPFK